MEKEKVNKILTVPLAITAGILGLVQGATWSVMSILSILCHYSEIIIQSNDGTYTVFIYQTFLYNKGPNDPSKIITPDEFFIFMWFYLVFSVVWLVTSVFIIWAMFRAKWNYTKHGFTIWSISGLSISIVDVVLTALIAADFNNVTETLDKYCYGIIMAIAARGFILWIVNLVFVCIMLKFASNLPGSPQNQTPTNYPYINAYEPSQHQPWVLPEPSQNQPYVLPDQASQAYSNPGFNRSESFYNLPPVSYDDNFNRRPSSPIYDVPPREDVVPQPAPMSFAEAIAQKTATIGRNKGKRSPPINVSSPYIPEPDYSPPNSPGLKSVLRSRSNY